MRNNPIHQLDRNNAQDEMFRLIEQKNYLGIRKLLLDGIDPNIEIKIDNNIYMPLLYSVFRNSTDNNSTDFLEAIVNLLLEHGADPNKLGLIGQFSCSPMQAAISCNNLGAMKLLFDNGADIHAPKCVGRRASCNSIDIIFEKIGYVNNNVY